MADTCVTGINQPPRNDAREGITHLGCRKLEVTQQQVTGSNEARQRTVLAQGMPTAVLSSKAPYVSISGRTLMVIATTACPAAANVNTSR
jgi:hypothetical protein